MAAFAVKINQVFLTQRYRLFAALTKKCTLKYGIN